MVIRNRFTNLKILFPCNTPSVSSLLPPATRGRSSSPAIHPVCHHYSPPPSYKRQILFLCNTPSVSSLLSSPQLQEADPLPLQYTQCVIITPPHPATRGRSSSPAIHPVCHHYSPPPSYKRQILFLCNTPSVSSLLSSPQLQEADPLPLQYTQCVIITLLPPATRGRSSSPAIHPVCHHYSPPPPSYKRQILFPCNTPSVSSLLPSTQLQEADPLPLQYTQCVIITPLHPATRGRSSSSAIHPVCHHYSPPPSYKRQILFLCNTPSVS